MSIPIYADTLVGDESGTAIGSTSVTARIEMPEDDTPDMPDSDASDAPEDVKTGDTVVIWPLALGILFSTTTVAVVAIRRKCL